MADHGVMMHDMGDGAAGGNILLTAVLAAWAAATAFWIGLGGVVWRIFFEPRIAELKAAREADNERCERELGAANARISQLETLLLFHGPGPLRAQMQAALSEEHQEMLARTAASGRTDL